MIAGKYITFPQLEIFLTTYTIPDADIIKSLIEESGAMIVLSFHDALVYIILMDAFLKITHRELRKFLKQIRSEHLVYIKQIFCPVL
jgi:hypothetical protein